MGKILKGSFYQTLHSFKFLLSLQFDKISYRFCFSILKSVVIGASVVTTTPDFVIFEADKSNS